MKLPLALDMEPMLSAISEAGIPKGDGWEYEPKWDGFRTLVFRDGDEVALMSRGGRPMTRYFPEVLPAFRALPQKKLVLDGELVVAGANGLDFGALQQRVHPAESRVRMLSEATPAWFIAFDVLAEGEADLRKLSLGARRARLEKLLKGVKQPIFLTPYTRDPKTANEWFEKFEGAGLDGVIAKSWDGAYGARPTASSSGGASRATVRRSARSCSAFTTRRGRFTTSATRHRSTRLSARSSSRN